MRRSITALTILLAATLNFNLASATERPTWALMLNIGGHPVTGEYELAEIPVTGNPADMINATEAAVRTVHQLSKFQLNVILKAPDGSQVDVTGSAFLIYRPKNCLRISQSGMAEVLDDAAGCSVGDPAPLSIIYADHSRDIAAINMYLFKVDAP